MKILLLYLLLGILGLSIIFTIDLLSGLSFSSTLQSLDSIYPPSSLMESAVMIGFLLLPVFMVIGATIKKHSAQDHQQS